MSARPNPIRDLTTISYQLAAGAHVTGCVYDAAGDLVASLVNSFQVPGRHDIVWNAADAAPGIYFFKLIAGDESSSSRLIRIN